MHGSSSSDAWPELALDDWLPTQATLHRWTQIVGKTRLALAPFQNHWWHCALYVTARGLATSPMPFRDGNVEIEFDFLSDALVARTSGGRTIEIRLEPKSVADFYLEYRAMLASLGVAVKFHAAPNEVPDATPFAEDRAHASYDAEAVRRWWRALSSADRALKEFRGRFVGKSSPSHFWWGSFDLASSVFSGRKAPPHPAGMRGLPDRIAREAYSDEVASAGFWASGVAAAEPFFYSYIYPEPDGYRSAGVQQGRFDASYGEYVLPYAEVRISNDPGRMLLEFFESAYEAGANLAKWDRAVLEREPVAP